MDDRLNLEPREFCVQPCRNVNVHMHTSAFPRDGDDNENGFHGGQSESEGLQRVGLRAVSQSHACTPRVSRTAARALSRGNDGRPVALDRGHIRRPEN